MNKNMIVYLIWCVLIGIAMAFSVSMKNEIIIIGIGFAMINFWFSEIYKD